MGKIWLWGANWWLRQSINGEAKSLSKLTDLGRRGSPGCFYRWNEQNKRQLRIEWGMEREGFESLNRDENVFKSQERWENYRERVGLTGSACGPFGIRVSIFREGTARFSWLGRGLEWMRSWILPGLEFCQETMMEGGVRALRDYRVIPVWSMVSTPWVDECCGELCDPNLCL